MMKRGACLALACLACWLLLVDEGEAQRVVGRHPGTIERTALSSDGKLLATGDTNGLVRLWDAQTGRMIHSLGAFRWEVYWTRFWARNRYLVASNFRDPRIWDVKTGKMKAVSHQLAGSFVSAFSPDNRTIAAWKWESAVQIWDVETAKMKGELEAVSEQLTALVFSHNGLLVAGAGAEGVYIWDLQTGELKTYIKTPTDDHSAIPRPSNYRIAFLPDDRSIASLSRRGVSGKKTSTVHVWDVETGERRLAFSENLINASFSPDSRFVKEEYAGTIRLWDLETGALWMELPEGLQYPVFSTDGRMIAALGWDIQNRTTPLHVWNVKTKQRVATYDGAYWYRLLLSSNGRLLAEKAVRREDTAIDSWDMETQEKRTFFVHASTGIRSVSFSPDGRSAASSHNNGWLTDDAVRVWDVSTGEEKINFKAEPGPIVYSPNGRYIAGVGLHKGIAVWDAETGETVMELNGRTPRSFLFTPDGTNLAFTQSFHGDGIVRYVNVTTGETVEAFHSPSDYLSELAISGDGLTLAAEGDGSDIHFWDVETRERIRTLTSSSPIDSLALSADGNFAAAGCKDSILRVWSVENGALQAKLRGHEGEIRAVAYSPDGRYIASAGDDSYLRLWSADTYELKNALTGHVGYVSSVVFSPDGRSFISGGKDGRVLLWSVEDLPIQWSDIKRPNSPLFLKNALLPNYPNPFNPETWIPFDLAQESSVTIAIYNSAGRTVRRMEMGELAAGSYRAKGKAAYWDGRNDLGAPAASGVYFARIEAGGYTETRRMVLLK
ncbi:MAG: T9SS type A sorting domain-containing protein [Candidatus Poribacteria bacterium]|nr:T9SS type A sorting domain-containing protein [Candidatus Poribacteria bacterium]